MSNTAVNYKNENLYCDTKNLIKEFAYRGVALLSPDTLGIPHDVHKDVYESVKNSVNNKIKVSPEECPSILKVLNAPGLISSIDQLVGKNWAIVPFTHNAPFISGSNDQHWHKDDNGPYNARKQRHHQSVQIEMLYFPEEVTDEMGPTAIIPYSQYWTFDHEENHDNFAGADHLDFDYVKSGLEGIPISGPDSKYDVDDIINRKTDHDIRMHDAVSKTGWPLVKPIEAAPLQAGSVVLYSHNTFHRGNHRRDDWNTWQDNPRFMWRFYIYRTTDTTIDMGREKKIQEEPWNKLGEDPLTKIDLGNVSDNLTCVWRYHQYWMKTGNTPPASPEMILLSKVDREKLAERLFEHLHTLHESGEPTRIGAAYKLASLGDSNLSTQMLGKALLNKRENVRRAATYGLVAVGIDATKTFIEATKSANKWIRKAGVYGLGVVGLLTRDVLDIIAERLKKDTSVYVRSVAADALGCLVRRSIAKNIGKELIVNCTEELLESLSIEENRLCMNLAQGKSIKFVRPTDECDVCEGNGFDFGFERFEPVRSAVRENVLWSIVILCSHNPEYLGKALKTTIKTLKEIIRSDKNAISVGFAMDALNRLAKLNSNTAKSLSPIKDLQEELEDILKQSPLKCPESLIRCNQVMG